MRESEGPADGGAKSTRLENVDVLGVGAAPGSGDDGGPPHGGGIAIGREQGIGGSLGGNNAKTGFRCIGSDNPVEPGSVKRGEKQWGEADDGDEFSGYGGPDGEDAATGALDVADGAEHGERGPARQHTPRPAADDLRHLQPRAEATVEQVKRVANEPLQLRDGESDGAVGAVDLEAEAFDAGVRGCDDLGELGR